jgi:glycosyltransferase involved in cell wall biosynthesis
LVLSNGEGGTEAPRKIVIVSDAWYPQVNGVVRTLQTVAKHLTHLGHEVTMLTPDQFRGVPCPTYPEIRLALNAWPRVGRMLSHGRPDSIFIATEGPLGLAARQFSRSRGLRFTTNYSTKFPEYIRLRFPIPEEWSYKYFRWFHNAADAVMVATPSLRRDLESRGIRNTAMWSRGVDTELFRPSASTCYSGLSRPIMLYVGRVAVEKNLETFLSLPLGGTKVVVGNGPAMSQLRKKFPGAVFAGEKYGQELVEHYGAADVLVFPSKTDTFGLVLLEALACGTPVAAFPVTGPIDVLSDSKVGALDEDLSRAVSQALTLDRQGCREYSLRFSWESCARTLLQHLGSNRLAWNGSRTRKKDPG